MLTTRKEERKNLSFFILELRPRLGSDLLSLLFVRRGPDTPPAGSFEPAQVPPATKEA